MGSGERSYAYFKFEPFVLHVVCRTLEDAQVMVSPHDSTRRLEFNVTISSLSLSQLFQMQVAVGSGFRNSGISCGKKGKIVVVCKLSGSKEAKYSSPGCTSTSIRE